VARVGIVLRTEPVVEALIARLRLLRRVELPVAVPFAEMACRVARALQQLRDRNLAAPQVHRMPRRDPVIHAEAVGFRPVSRPARLGEQTGAAA